MSIGRRSLVAAAATLPLQTWLKALADKPDSVSERLVLTRFTGSNPEVLAGGMMNHIATPCLFRRIKRRFRLPENRMPSAITPGVAWTDNRDHAAGSFLSLV